MVKVVPIPDAWPYYCFVFTGFTISFPANDRKQVRTCTYRESFELLPSQSYMRYQLKCDLNIQN